MKVLARIDPEIAEAIALEHGRQQNKIELLLPRILFLKPSLRPKGRY